MRTGMLTLSAPDGSTLVAWKNNDQIGWQLYDRRRSCFRATRFREESGAGVAGVVDKEGRFVLFR